MPTPVFPTSQANVSKMGMDSGISLAGAVPGLDSVNWQLFGGSFADQVLSNDMIIGQWLDTQELANNSVANFKRDYLLKYYDYDGYILMADIIIKAGGA